MKNALQRSHEMAKTISSLQGKTPQQLQEIKIAAEDAGQYGIIDACNEILADIEAKEAEFEELREPSFDKVWNELVEAFIRSEVASLQEKTPQEIREIRARYEDAGFYDCVQVCDELLAESGE